jgi:LVIVD repeat
MGGRLRRAIGRGGSWRNPAHLIPVLIIIGSNLVVMSASGALPLGPLNDLLALGQGGGQTPAKVPIQKNAEPSYAATPQANCGPGSKPEPGVQGRVPAGSANNGLWCNASLVSHQGTSGGFKTLRYVDTKGHTCAFYDTALLFPGNALKLDGSSVGVAVLDMSDPKHPVQTDRLTEAPMMSPHESLALNTKRGLLAAVLGNPTTYPGLVSIYDAHKDCRHPELQSTLPLARLGHESGFSIDGKTFYATGTAYQAITAIDVTDPKHPHDVWQGNVLSHGMSLSNDGNRAYIADTNGNMLILDTSQIQARKPDPQAREISRLTWDRASIPQNAIPFTRKGHPYVLEFDEYTAGTTSPGGDKDAVGAARIIDIGDETHPRVIANIRLQVDNPAEHHAAAGDPGANSPVQGYAAHYCNFPSRVNPKVVACSFIASGLRVFDISKLRKPKEIAYFVSPTQPRFENGEMASDFAMSQPAIDLKRRSIWFTDGGTGFYNVRVSKKVWPYGAKHRKKHGRHKHHH